MGEIYALFERNVSDWSFENWTSRLRVENGHPPFTGLERDFSDFTYLDTHGHMKDFLLQAGLDLNPAYASNTTYHLEVKTTTGGDGEIFYVSQNQVNMVYLVREILCWVTADDFHRCRGLTRTLTTRILFCEFTTSRARTQISRLTHVHGAFILMAFSRLLRLTDTRFVKEVEILDQLEGGFTRQASAAV